MTIPVMPIMGPLIRYAAIKGYSKIGPEGTAVFAAAMIHPVSRTIALRIAGATIYHSTAYSWNMTKAVSKILYQELILPAAAEVVGAVSPWYTAATRFGTAPGAGVAAGVAFFAIAFPLAMATTDNASYGNLYTQEIAEYEHSALGQGSGMGIVI